MILGVRGLGEMKLRCCADSETVICGIGGIAKELELDDLKFKTSKNINDQISLIYH